MAFSADATTSHGGRLPFNRPPRIRRALSATSVRVPAPPPKMQPPQSSVVTSIGIPMITAVIMGSVYFASSLQNPQPGRFNYMQCAAVAMVLGSVLPMILMFLHERNSFKRKATEQSSAYRAKLADVDRQLQSLRAEEIDLRRDLHPSEDEVVARSESHSHRLWERRPEDDDFLHLRLGLGMMPTMLQIVCEPGEEGYDLAEQANTLADKFRHIGGVPITCDLPSIGALGIAGATDRVTRFARSMLAQLAAHHSPEEVRVIAFFGADDVADWSWLKWLPHTRSLSSNDPGDRSLCWNPAGSKRLSEWLMTEMSNRERAAAEGEDQSVKSPHLVVLVRDYESVRGEVAFDMLLSRGKAIGASFICLAGDPLALPGECAAVLTLSLVDGDALYTRAGPEPSPVSLTPDSLEAAAGERLARALAPLMVVKTSARGQEDVPNRVGFLEMMSIPYIDDLNVAEVWSHTEVRALLRAPIGLGAGEVLQYLDLKEPDKGGHGPHGLVAGTTGAGKSELLRSLVAGLALHHSPETLTFLLVDYKGGGAFGALSALPHVVGLVTDLDPGLADRALVALRAELKKRERLMHRVKECGAANLEEYQSLRGARAPIPFLFIVVDEFAQLKSEMPDFIEGLIEVARVGRSLGVRLLLATQTPSGTVDGEIQKNSNYGICLRVRDAGDSREVIAQPDAFMLPARIPGRAFLKVAGEPIKLFQSAYISGKHEPRTSDKVATINDFLPLPRSRRNVDAEMAAEVSFQTAKETELEAVVTRLVAAAADLGLGQPDQIWPDPLPSVLPLSDECLLPAVEESSPFVWPVQPPFGPMATLVGLLDEPAAQKQDPFRIDFLQSGSLLVFGAPGSGKSTFLRTLALSLAMTHTPAAFHLYCLDFGSRALKALEGLPHCGGVLLPVDGDRIKRLVRTLGAEVLHRKAALSEANATSVEGFNVRAEQPLPYVLVLIDNYAAFREMFEEEEQSVSQEHTMSDLAVLVRDGPAMGVFFAITTSVFNAVNGTVANVIGTRIALRQADDLDYGLVGRLSRAPGRIPPGRGFVAGSPPLEFQAALPVSEDNTGLKDVVDRLSSSWIGSRPQVVERLPDQVWLLPLLDSVASARSDGGQQPVPLVLGLDDRDLRPLVFDLQRENQLLITGPAGSGKTSLLLDALLSVARPGSNVAHDIFLAAIRPSPIRELASLPCVKSVAIDMESFAKQVEELERVVEERRGLIRSVGTSGSTGGTVDSLIIIAIDDYDALLQEDDFSLMDNRLRNLARRGVPVGLRLLVAGLNSELRNSSDRLTRYLGDGRTGVLLQPDMELDGMLLYARLRRSGQSDMPPGRGYLVSRQHLKLMQAACIERENEGLSAAVRRWLAEGAAVGLPSPSM